VGVDRGGPGAGQGGRAPLTGEAIVRVVPDVPTFALDAGFSYAADEALAVGTIVRVPLGGRVVRGYVVGEGKSGHQKLKNVRSISGERPIFDEALLEALRWAATHYVAPLAVLLGRSAPPNLPRRVEPASLPPVAESGASPLPEVTEAAAAGRYHRSHYLLGGRPWTRPIAGLLAPVLAAGRSAIVILATGREVTRSVAALAESFPGRVVEVAPEAHHRVVTEAWSRAAGSPGLLIVGTPRISLWPVRHLGIGVVVEEGRRAMKERQTPTLHARDVLTRRGAIERFPLVFVGHMPTTEVVAGGAAIVRLPGSARAWPLVEVVDRRDEPPGEGVIGRRVRTALSAAVRTSRRVFVFTHRRGYAPAARCSECSTLRVCGTCGARPDPGTECRRCGATLTACVECGGRRFAPLGAGVGRVAEELRRIVGPEEMAPNGTIMVGTERDLAGLGPFDLTIAVDADGLILGTNYRAAEEALRILARLAAAVGSGEGRRMMLQTIQPSHPVIVALRRGNPLPFLRHELEERRRMGFPPAGELIVVELANPPEGFGEGLERIVTRVATLLGPAESARGERWLIQGRDLGPVRLALRDLVQRARDEGARVRIDADPIDL
jgi:primosomal protein N' (replication factor Y)